MTHSNTPYLGLNTYNVSRDENEFMADYINDVSGSHSSQNIGILDAFAGRVSASLTELDTNINGLYNKLADNPASFNQINSGSSNTALLSPYNYTRSDYGQKIVTFEMNNALDLNYSNVAYCMLQPVISGWYLTKVVAISSTSPIDGNVSFSLYKVPYTSASGTSGSPIADNITISQGEYISNSFSDNPINTIHFDTNQITIFDRVVAVVTASATGVKNAQITMVFSNYQGVFPPD